MTDARPTVSVIIPTYNRAALLIVPGGHLWLRDEGRAAVELMRQKKLGCVIVVDGQGRPVGKFTERKLMKLLLASPAVQTLRLIGQQFPLLRAPSIVDPHPRMKPLHENWRDWLGKHFPGRR